MFPENLNVSLDEVEGNIEKSKKQNLKTALRFQPLLRATAVNSELLTG